MPKLELLSPEQLRIDGRRPREPRRFRCRVGWQTSSSSVSGAACDGSAYVEMGNTKVLVTVSGPHEVASAQQARASDAAAFVVCDVAMAPFATGERKKRAKGDRRLQEYALLIQDTLEATIQLHLFPRSQIDVAVHVMQADGGILPAAINAASLAVLDAGIAVYDLVTACAAGLIDGEPILDLNYPEETANVPVIPLAIHPATGKVVTVVMHARMPFDFLDPTMALAVDGCHQIHAIIADYVSRRTQALLRVRGAQPESSAL
jgi:exosome complex component RRP41